MSSTLLVPNQLVLVLVLLCACLMSCSSALGVGVGNTKWRTTPNNSAVPKELKYFDARGAAEIVRVLLHLGEVEYTDTRFKIEMKDGKFNTPDFTAAKEAGVLDVNLARAPILVLSNGVVLGQSKAMERYISRMCGMLGGDEVEAALIDAVAENVRDVKDRFSKVRSIGGMGPNPEKEAATKKFFEAGGEWEQWLGKLEKSLSALPGRVSGFAVGKALSYADILIWHMLTDWLDDKEASLSISTKFTELTAIAAQVEANPKLKDYLAARPKTMF